MNKLTNILNQTSSKQPIKQKSRPKKKLLFTFYKSKAYRNCNYGMNTYSIRNTYILYMYNTYMKTISNMYISVILSNLLYTMYNQTYRYVFEGSIINGIILMVSYTYWSDCNPWIYTIQQDYNLKQIDRLCAVITCENFWVAHNSYKTAILPYICMY